MRKSGALEKWELVNFLHSVGISDVSEALRLKSINKNDYDILAHYKILPKTYHKWVKAYSSIVGKSVMVRKRGKLVSMLCGECGGIVRWDAKHDRICDKCGLVVDNATQKGERVRYALREVGKGVDTNKKARLVKDLLTVDNSEELVIKTLSQL